MFLQDVHIYVQVKVTNNPVAEYQHELQKLTPNLWMSVTVYYPESCVQCGKVKLTR